MVSTYLKTVFKFVTTTKIAVLLCIFVYTYVGLSVCLFVGLYVFPLVSLCCSSISNGGESQRLLKGKTPTYN